MEKQQDITNNGVNINSDRSSRPTSMVENEINDNELTLHNSLKEKKNADHLSVKSETTETTEAAEVVKNPKHWPRRKKNMILLIVSLAGMMSPISSTYVNTFMIIFKMILTISIYIIYIYIYFFLGYFILQFSQWKGN
jgi:hypothetical protein